MTANLPDANLQVVEFVLDEKSLARSNQHFKDYTDVQGSLQTFNQKDGKRHNKWSSLVFATQFAYHSALVRLGERLKAAMMIDPDDPEDFATIEAGAVEGNETSKAIYQEWLEELEFDRRWSSPRVDTILDIYDIHRTLFRNDCKVVILDESVFFLDILRIAFKYGYYPRLSMFRFDGCMDLPAREESLRAFGACDSPAVIFVSRGCGGEGVNMQAANCLIMCRGFWKQSWELQAKAPNHSNWPVAPLLHLQGLRYGLPWRRSQRTKKNQHT